MKHIILVLVLSFFASNAFAIKFRYIGKKNIETGTTFENTEIGGLSGISYDSANDNFVVISDQRELPHFYRFKANITQDSFDFRPTSVTFLRDQTNHDSEGISMYKNGHMFISTEGNGKSSPQIPNLIQEYSSNGELLYSLSLPESFQYDLSVPAQRGTLANRGLESLSVSPDGQILFSASEVGLIQDDTPSSFEKGSMARILRFNLDKKTIEQFAYNVDLVSRPQGQVVNKGMSALSDILAIDENHFYSLEKSVAIVDGKTTVQNKIYLVSLTGASEISDLVTIRGAKINSAHKTLVLDLMNHFEQIANPSGYLENFEGLTFGPMINGHKTLILVADNNFDKSQQTQFVAFEIIE